MTRPLACLLLSAALAPLPAQGRPAAGRQEIGRTVAGTPVYLESRTLRRHGDTVTVAVRAALAPPIRHPAGDLVSTRTLTMVHCPTRTVATRESWYYTDAAGTKTGMHRTVKIPGFGPATKGSLGDVVLRHLCATG
jgi:hypothetical protein